MQLSNYCSLPFRGMQIECNGELKPCCLYKPHLDKSIKQYHISEYQDWWTSRLTPLRQTVLDNQIDPGCASCFDSTIKDHPMKLVADKMFNYTTQVSNTPEWLDIRFGNFCNLKCLMCTPWNSSQIEQEYHSNESLYGQQGIHYIRQKYSDNWWDRPDQFQRVVDIVNRARYVNFSGGEPLMMPALYRLLDAMNSDCTITFNTNLTRVTDQAIQYFKKFSNIMISVSLDGVESHQEYIRWGSNWHELDNNIQKIFALDSVSVNFSYLLQHTSVYTWPAMWRYLEQFDQHIMVYPVYAGTINDGMLTQNSVVPADMQKFADWHRANSTPYDSAIDQWIGSYKFDLVKHQQYRDYVGMLDKIRGCNFVKTFNPSW